ncbi:DUF202 domain-containing protein [Asanoa sp. WMMD1127]|uniref:DUF202 domain-containing protein n=1 Tax=Asanoa sp. WMMD1127 TaxID=3016107 RepID=UPI002415F720|nr:DUF202 domain-containing protein [Asanoa sp. WMMD1127]MDG4825564.1 DUF202 domain-containing protein [Asanoa sp. WMMD1127]
MTRPGLQTERTALAWTRTAAVALVTGVLLARLGLHGGAPLPFVGAAAAGALAVLAGWRRRRRVVTATTAVRPRALLVFTGLATACGVLAVAGVLAAA